MTVIERVKQLCKENHVSLGSLEKTLGFANKSLYERKGDPPLNIRSDRLLQIADYFGVTTDWLLKGYDKNYEHLTAEERDIVMRYDMLDEDCKQELFAYIDFLDHKSLSRKKDSEFSGMEDAE